MQNTFRLNGIDDLIDSLVKRGYGVAPDFLPAALVDALHREQAAAFRRGLARPAGVGRRTARAQDASIRGDSILWWDPHHLSPVQALYWRAIEDLRAQLNQSCFLNLTAYECHYARYQPGHGYARHRDAFLDDGHRLVSTVFYLNPAWQPDDGGVLRLYLSAADGEATVDILPTGGTLVLLKSQEIEHAVLAPRRCRDSLTGWLRTRD